MPKVDAAEVSFSKASQQLEVFDQELENSLKAKDLASLKLAVGEARVQDMATEIALTEERLRILKERKNVLDQAVGKLRVDIIKAKSKLSRKRSLRQVKVSLVEETRKYLEEAQVAKAGVAKQPEELKLAIRTLLA